MRGNTILVVIDLAAGAHQPALERAAGLAKQAGARVELFACDYDPDLGSGRIAAVRGGDSGPRDRVLARRREQLEQLAAPLRKSGLTVSVDVVAVTLAGTNAPLIPAGGVSSVKLTAAS